MRRQTRLSPCTHFPWPCLAWLWLWPAEPWPASCRCTGGVGSVCIGCRTAGSCLHVTDGGREQLCQKLADVWTAGQRTSSSSSSRGRANRGQHCSLIRLTFSFLAKLLSNSLTDPTHERNSNVRKHNNMNRRCKTDSCRVRTGLHATST